MTQTTTPKTIVITGASDGIGAAAARQLQALGHRVVIVGRSPQKTEAIAQELGANHYLADFARLDDVRTLAAELNANYPRIDVLANNAGGIFGDQPPTVDGFEQTFQVNHLAPFLLTRLLMATLIASQASVIQTASIAARVFGHLDLDDLNHDDDFNPQRAYGTAKLENILFTQELHRRYHGQGISAAAFHPGIVATSFAAESSSVMRLVYGSRIFRRFMTSSEAAARQLVWLAQSTPGVDWEPGLYYEKRKPARRLPKQAQDPALARQLWDRSEQLIADSTPSNTRH